MIANATTFHKVTHEEEIKKKQLVTVRYSTARMIKIHTAGLTLRAYDTVTRRE